MWHHSSVMSLCCVWSIYSLSYYNLSTNNPLSLLFSPPLPFSLSPSNDRGIIFLPLIAFLLPPSLFNDCSYLILPYPSLVFPHTIPPTLCPPSRLPVRLILLQFSVLLALSPSIPVSTFLFIDPVNLGWLIVFLFIWSCNLYARSAHVERELLFFLFLNKNRILNSK